MLAEFTAEKDFSNVVYSGEGISSGQEYTVAVDGQSMVATAGTSTGGGMGGGAAPTADPSSPSPEVTSAAERPGAVSKGRIASCQEVRLPAALDE